MASYKSTFLNNSLTRQKLSQMNQNTNMKNGLTGKYNMYLNKKNSKNSFKDDTHLQKSFESRNSIKEGSCWLLTLDLINFIQSLCIGKLSSQGKWSVLELYANAKNIKTNFDAKLDKRLIEKYKLTQKRNSNIKNKSVGSPSTIELNNPKINNTSNIPHSYPSNNGNLNLELFNSINGNNSCVLTRSEELRAKLQAEFFYSHQHTLSNKFVQAAQHFYKSFITRNTVKTGDKNNEIWPSNETKITKMKSLDSLSNKSNNENLSNQNFGINIKSKRNTNGLSLSTSLPATSFMDYYSSSPLSSNNNHNMANSISANSDLQFNLDEDIITEEKEDDENDDNYIYSSDEDNMDEDKNYGNCMDDQLYTYLQNKNIKTYY